MPFPTITPTIPALVRSCAARSGDKPFLIADGNELTYVDLDLRVVAAGDGAARRRASARATTSASSCRTEADWVVAFLRRPRGSAPSPYRSTRSWKAPGLSWGSPHADVSRDLLCQPSSYLSQRLHRSARGRPIPSLATTLERDSWPNPLSP